MQGLSCVHVLILEADVRKIYRRPGTYISVV